MKRTVDGINSNHWVDPWGRDTTRGHIGVTDSVFPSMHSSELQATVQIASCQCCGVTFGFMEMGKPPKNYCPSHSWLEMEKPLGKLYVSDMQYQDRYSPECTVTGRLVRYSYFIPETDPREQEKLFLGLRAWLVEDYLEQGGPYAMPRVVKIDKGVWVTDLQRLQRVIEGNHGHGGPISSRTLAKLMKRMDEVYVESL